MVTRVCGSVGRLNPTMHRGTNVSLKMMKIHILQLSLPQSANHSSSSSDTVQSACRAASSAALSHTGGFRVGGGVHDSYTFQCGLVGSFTSPGIDTTA